MSLGWFDPAALQNICKALVKRIPKTLLKLLSNDEEPALLDDMDEIRRFTSELNSVIDTPINHSLKKRPPSVQSGPFSADRLRREASAHEKYTPSRPDFSNEHLWHQAGEAMSCGFARRHGQLGTSRSHYQ